MKNEVVINQYLEEKRVPELLESLMAGIMYHQPEDPVAYIQKCLTKVSTDKAPPSWNSFVPSPQSNSHATSATSSVSTKSIPSKKLNAIFIIGGPGSGKGTQCARLVDEYHVAHISVGDLLRDEVKRGTERGKSMDQLMKDGKIVPLDIVLSILGDRLSSEPKDRFILIDGFPREMAQVSAFEEKIGTVRSVFYFDCSEAAMEKRLLKRGETSGRADDNAETIKKRFKTFQEQSMAVVEHFQKAGSLCKISTEAPVDEVYAQVKAFYEQAINQ
eukprot:Partr_v1_DN28288_c1_g2_i2_m75644 putative adenylate kinase